MCNLMTSLCHGRFSFILKFFVMFTIQHTLAEDVIPIEIGKNITLTCVSSSRNMTWIRQNDIITGQNNRFVLENLRMENLNGSIMHHHLLTIPNISLVDDGIISCNPNDETNETLKTFNIKPFLIPRIVLTSKKSIKQKIGQGVMLYCVIEVFPVNASFKSQIKWTKDDTFASHLNDFTNVVELNRTHINVTLEMPEVYKKENGTYACSVPSFNNNEAIKRGMNLLVMDVPQVTIDYVKAVGASKIFMNWTVIDGNDPIQMYFVQYMQEDAPTFTYYNHVIGGKNLSYVLENFLPNTTYLLRMSAKNSIGGGPPHQYHQPVRTLVKDPIFIPRVETTGSTASTITIGWDPPPSDVMEYIQFYELVVSETGENPKVIEEAIYQQNSRNLPYMFDNLKTATAYEFKVRACSDLTKLCGPWSEIVNGTTMDGVASKPTELKVTCSQHNVSHLNSVAITWNSPKTPNGKVVSYLIHLDGKSTYRLQGQLHEEKWGPKIRRVDEPHHKTVYEGVNPNTNFTVTVSAITRHRKIGESAIGKCTMPISVPEVINRIMWTKIKTADNKCVFKLFLPKISERNGPICCYRIYLIRTNYINKELPPPNYLNISTYHEVHSPNNSFGGTYIAEIFSGDNFKSEIFLGDGKRFRDAHENEMYKTDETCRKCFEGISYSKKNYLKPHSNTFSTTTEMPEELLNMLPEQSQRIEINKASNLTDAAAKILDNKKRRRRNPKVVVGQNNLQDLVENFSYDLSESNQNVDLFPSPAQKYKIYDGEIDMNSNYTGFLEVIVRDKNIILTAYSNYFEIMTPGTEAEYMDSVTDATKILNIVIQILGVLIGIALLLLISLCFLHNYITKTSETGEDVSLRDSLSRVLCGGRSSTHRHFIGAATSKSSDIGPIQKQDLAQAYKNRHKDTDYGFLREYEMLPTRFSDRTTKNSDLKENSVKNRYPDIKAYDQTRVKLSQINGIPSSDYINANFVIGYKERKKFICAQGPMESTISDFWRMIWEQHLEIIVMLTNLEEYNKAKCAKYWPEKVSDCKQFGDITVKFISEQRFGDFLTRNLEVFRRIASNEFDEERRQITQYHYLVWKDFMAPEHPYGIIRFVRTINRIYSVQRGPILVHCSAGVGRTGTLVAIDSLMQQLEEEEHVSIYNTVCDLRHQRNFLVQSLASIK